VDSEGRKKSLGHLEVVGANCTRAGKVHPAATGEPKRLLVKVPVRRDAPEAYSGTRLRRHYWQRPLEFSQTLLIYASCQKAGMGSVSETVVVTDLKSEDTQLLLKLISA
jgi:hypothetical protein